MKKKSLVIVFVVLCMVLSYTMVALAEGELTYGVPSDIRTLDPSLVADRLDSSVVWAICETLAIRDNNGVSQPNLAVSWKQIEPTVWELKLREGVKFTDGEDFTADDVVYSFERAQDPQFGNNYQLPSQILLKEVKVIDDYTIQLVTEQPSNTVGYWLAESPIYPRDYYTNHTVEEVGLAPVGSGPYTLGEWVMDDHITLLRNENYWGEAPVYDRVTFRVIPEESSRLNELTSGNIDIVNTLSLDQASLADSDISHAEYVVGLRKMHLTISFNGNEALKDKRVRQALNYAIDKEALVNDLLGGNTKILSSYVNPPNNNPDLVPYTYDPEKAKALLEEAGYGDGLELTLNYRPGAYGFDKEIVLACADYLAQVGIKCNLEQIESGLFWEKMEGKAFDGLVWHGWAALINPVVENLILTCGHIDNGANYCNPEFDEIYKQMLAADSDEEIQKLNYQLQAIAWEDAPWVYLWSLPQVYGVNNDVTYAPRPDGYLFPWEIGK